MNVEQDKVVISCHPGIPVGGKRMDEEEGSGGDQKNNLSVD